MLFVLEYYYPHIGGGENLFKNLTHALVRAGHEVTVVTLRVPGTVRTEVLEGVKVIRIAAPRFADRHFFTLLALPTVLRLARWADIIHTTIFNAAIPAALGSALARRPAVLTVHEVFGAQWQHLPGLHPLAGRAYRLFERAMLRLPFRYFVCDSHFTAARLRQVGHIPEARIGVVYPAVDYDFWDRRRYAARDLRRELGLADDTPLYLYFGRPGISKGVEYLIAAATRIRAALPQSHLVLILGRKPPAQYRRMLRALEERGLGDHVTVLDMVPGGQLPTYLLAADCVVSPSISEGFGYAAVEAATLGCPVVATTGHSVAEVLAGYAHFVAPRDASALASGVLAVLRDGAPPRELRRFDIEAHIAGTLAVYDHIRNEAASATLVESRVDAPRRGSVG